MASVSVSITDEGMSAKPKASQNHVQQMFHTLNVSLKKKTYKNPVALCIPFILCCVILHSL